MLSILSSVSIMVVVFIASLLFKTFLIGTIILTIMPVFYFQFLIVSRLIGTEKSGQSISMNNENGRFLIALEALGVSLITSIGLASILALILSLTLRLDMNMGIEVFWTVFILIFIDVFFPTLIVAMIESRHGYNGLVAWLGYQKHHFWWLFKQKLIFFPLTLVFTVVISIIPILAIFLVAQIIASGAGEGAFGIAILLGVVVTGVILLGLIGAIQILLTPFYYVLYRYLKAVSPVKSPPDPSQSKNSNIFIIGYIIFILVCLSSYLLFTSQLKLQNTAIKQSEKEQFLEYDQAIITETESVIKYLNSYTKQHNGTYPDSLRSFHPTNPEPKWLGDPYDYYKIPNDHGKVYYNPSTGTIIPCLPETQDEACHIDPDDTGFTLDINFKNNITYPDGEGTYGLKLGPVSAQSFLANPPFIDKINHKLIYNGRSK